MRVDRARTSRNEVNRAAALDEIESVQPCPIDRCYCHDVTLSTLIELARTSGIELDLDQIGNRTGAGTSCGLCRPYIRAALATGRARFPVMDEAALDRLVELAASQAAPVRRA
jgi:bacterioferritin-associated ferredoxin